MLTDDKYQCLRRRLGGRVAGNGFSARLGLTLAVLMLRASRVIGGMRDQYSVSLAFSYLPSEVRFFSGSHVLCSSLKLSHLTRYMVTGRPLPRV